MFNIKICGWLDSNRGPLVSQATALPTELQPLPEFCSYLNSQGSIYSQVLITSHQTSLIFFLRYKISIVNCYQKFRFLYYSASENYVVYLHYHLFLANRKMAVGHCLNFNINGYPSLKFLLLYIASAVPKVWC